MGKEERIGYKVNWDSVANMERGAVAEYDREADTLLVQTREHRPAVSVDCDGEFWLRVVPESGEIVGVEIEDFTSFRKAHRKVFKKGEDYLKPVAEVIRLKKGPA